MTTPLNACVTGLTALIAMNGLLADEDRSIHHRATETPLISLDRSAQHHATGPASAVLYGRVTKDDGSVLQGRLRFGGNEEAYWDEAFNAVKSNNPWARFVPDDALRVERPRKMLGLSLGSRTDDIDLQRPFMTAFGNLKRIDAQGNDFRITLRSGTEISLERCEADDLADGVRVWDAARGIVDVDEWSIRSIEFLTAPATVDAPARLAAEVQTTQGRFNGPVQWGRQFGVASDLLIGEGAEGELQISFDGISRIERLKGELLQVTLKNGQTVLLTRLSPEMHSERGLYVNDSRFGRVLVNWAAFKHMDLIDGFHDSRSARPGPGVPLAGSVRTRDGQTHRGRIVFDLDESESTDTLDAPDHQIDYSIPFSLIASVDVVNHRDRSSESIVVQLCNDERLLLEQAGDLDPLNPGLLIFKPDDQHPVYIPWGQVQHIDQDALPLGCEADEA